MLIFFNIKVEKQIITHLIKIKHYKLISIEFFKELENLSDI